MRYAACCIVVLLLSAAGASRADVLIPETVFVVDSGGRVLEVRSDGSRFDTGGLAAGGVDACAAGPSVIVAVKGMDGAAWTARGRDGAWTWASRGGRFTSDVAVACLPDGTVALAARGMDGAPYVRLGDAAWTGLGGASKGAPDLAAAADGTLHLVVRGLDDAVHHRSLRGGAWTAWRSVGAVVAADPCIVAPASGPPLLLVTGTDRHLWHAPLPESGAAAWSPLAAQLLGAPDAAVLASGAVEVVLRGTDGVAWTVTRDASGWQAPRRFPFATERDPGIAGSGSPPGPIGMSAPPPEAPRDYRLFITGLTVERETIDDVLERDGARDEVYLAPVLVRVGSGGSTAVEGPGARSSIFGQRTSPDRVQAGRATGTGGLRTGDSFPADPWAMQVPPALGVTAGLALGELAPGTGVAIIPALWEADGDASLRERFDASIGGAAGAFAGPIARLQSVLADFSARSFVTTTRDLALPAMLQWGGGPADRPVGVVREGSGVAWHPPVILLTRAVADRILASRFTHESRIEGSVSEGGPLEPGQFVVRLQDDDEHQGIYVLHFRLARAR